MKYLTRMKNEGGFSLVELMVAVGIIGVMSSVAVPKYQKFTANAAQSEAQATLSSVYTLQQLYFTENGRYGTGFGSSAGNIGYTFPANSKYLYDTTSSPTSGTSAHTQFKATAISKKLLASCAAVKDKWCVNHDKVLANKATNPTPEAPCVATGGSADVAFGGCT